MAKKTQKTDIPTVSEVVEYNNPTEQQPTSTNLQTLEPASTNLETSDPFSSLEGVSKEEYASTLDAIAAASSANIGAGEIQISRLAIAQPGTPEVAGGEEGWQAGVLFDNITRDILTDFGKSPWLILKGIPPTDIKTRPFLPFVPIFRLPSEYVKWPSKAEREQGIKSFHWKSTDPQEPRVREGSWKPKGTWVGKGAPPVTEHLNVLGVCLSLTGEIKSNPIIASFSRTSFKSGGRLVTQCVHQKINNLPFWGRVYYLFTNKKQDAQNTWYVIDFAKGERLDEYCIRNGESESPIERQEQGVEQGKEIFKYCFDLAKELAKSRDLQEQMINAAAFGEELSEDTDATDVDSTATEDPNF